MKFDLDRMGPIEFERLVQALALSVLGNGVNAFGQGKDGGREATFRGEVPFPVGQDALWNGYGVVQAKHRQQPDPRTNADWLKGQLKKEFDAWKSTGKDKPKRRKRPEYYLIATNLRLSGTEDTGGIDSIEAYLEEERLGLGMKGTFVWHYDQICTYLMANPGIRRTFAGFVTTGDVLDSMLKLLEPGSSADLGKKLYGAATGEIVSKQWVRFDQAGYEDNMKLSLSSIGIDLPAFESDSKTGDGPTAVTVVDRVIQIGDRALLPSAESELPRSVVVIGGPGQGKTTLSQMICQAYRAALAEDSPPKDGTIASHALIALRAHFALIGLTAPVHKRWPVQVDLSKLADAVAAGDHVSVMSYIASQVLVEGERLKTNELAKWRHAWPWLVVFDGLDEVPQLGMRERLMEAIIQFIVEVQTAGDDVFIVGTTRPQGYQGEFDLLKPVQLTLSELTPALAVTYGESLSGLRHAKDPELHNQVVERLRQAISEPVAEKLMKSPLQVTIMTYLFERSARVPQSRHGLFDSFYATIYARETTKGGRVGKILAEHREAIDYVHEHVGLFLQVQNEHAGSSEAVVPSEDFEALLTKKLGTDGHTATEASRLSKELVKAATDRLVLLVRSTDGSIGFELRSFQEYMAGRALLDGSDAEVIAAFHSVARSVIWRNAWLLGVGRLYSQRRHLRTNLLMMLRALDSESLDDVRFRPGSRLALEMLDDSIGIDIPRIRHALLEQGLNALALPGAFSPVRVARVLMTFGDLDGQSKVLVTNALAAS